MDGVGQSVVGRAAILMLARTLLLSLPLVALALTPVVLDPGPLSIPSVILIVVLVPVLVGVGLRTFTGRLTGRGTELVHIDWRGREQVVPGADVAWAGIALVVLPMGDGRPRKWLVVARHSAAPPLVLGVSRWNRGEIRRLFSSLGLELEQAAYPISVRQLRDWLPSYRPPFPVRNPLLTSLVIYGSVAVVWSVAGAWAYTRIAS